MRETDLKKRTRRFALDIIRFVEKLPKDETCRVLGWQLLRSGTSVGANYRAACRAKSPADFVAKMGTVEEESDESGFWIALLIDSGKVPIAVAGDLIREADELTAIAVASINTAKRSGGRR
jgi:four helix bundle protein